MMIIRALLSVTETTNQTSKTVPAKKIVPMDAHVPTMYVKVRAIEPLIISHYWRNSAIFKFYLESLTDGDPE